MRSTTSTGLKNSVPKRPAEIWAQLRETADDAPGWHFRRLDAASPINLLAGIQKPGNIPGLLLEVAPGSVSRTTEYPQSRGFVLRPELITSAGSRTVRLSLALSEAAYEEVFAVLADDVAQAVRSSAREKDAVEALLGRLIVWQSFMKRQRAEGLQRSEVIGLYGEMIAINMLLDAGMSPHALINAWCGPLDGLWDFKFDDVAVEVKTTSQVPPSTISVSTLAQLDETRVRKLFLSHVALVESEEGRSLAELAVETGQKIEAIDRTALPTWKDLLIQSGYLEGTGLSESLRLRLVSLNHFLVEGEFPRIVPSDVSSGIVTCVYDIQLAAIDPYRVTRAALLAELGIAQI
jgi:hypothetical protein